MRYDARSPSNREDVLSSRQTLDTALIGRCAAGLTSILCGVRAARAAADDRRWWDLVIHDKVLGALLMASRSTTPRTLETARELASYGEPDFVVLNASKTSDPDWQSHGLNSEVFTVFNMTE